MRLLPRDYLKAGGWKVIPNGIDTKEYAAVGVSAQDLSGDPALLTIGNVTRRKGQHRVIRALPRMIQIFPALHYHMIGIPTLKPEMERIAEALGVFGRITLHGKIAARHTMLSLARSADIFIMLSENQKDGDVEGFGIAILEANALGIPAIGAKGSGIEGAIQSGYNGILVDGNKPEETVAALQEILRDYEGYRARALTWAERHGWEKLIREYTSFIFQPV
jgi:phosphatidylinositol alpha-1,6-mannosyltransferase